MGQQVFSEELQSLALLAKKAGRPNPVFELVPGRSAQGG
jgi:hypothetical protein